MSETQSRFIEDCSRFDQPNKPTRAKLMEVPPSEGNQSSNPGPWLTQAVAIDADEDAIFIRDAFPVRLPVGTVPRELPDSSTTFKYLDTPNVLSGRQLREYLAVNRESLVSLSLQEGEESDQDADSTAEERGEAEDERDRDTVYKTPAPVSQRAVKITDDQLNAHYSFWFDEPTADKQQRFFESLYNFIWGKVRMLHSDDTTSKRGESQDLGQEHLLKLLPQLIEQQKLGNRLDNPAHYVTRGWTYAQWTRNRSVAAHARRFTSTTAPGAVDEGDEEYETDVTDQRAAAKWFRQQRVVEVQDETQEQYLARCESMLNKIPDESLQDIAGMWLALMTEQEIAAASGISTQKVGRLKVKIRKQLAAMRA